MLGIHRVGPGGAGYYLADLAPELPARVPGGWAGAASPALGLEGTVDPADLGRLLEGRHPGTGGVLASGRATVAAYDLTLSAPKSVSILYGLGDRDLADAVVGAHRDAASAALRYVEDHALTAVRRSGPSATVVPTGGAAAAVFTHGVSRNLDPHLHSHVVLANVAHGADGRWSSVDQRGLFAHRHAVSAVYEAHLRANLTATLGARWVATRSDAFELAGVGPELIGVFSSRQADIRARRHEWAVRSRQGKRVAWAATRPSKEQEATFEDLSRLWRAKARESAPHIRVLEDALGGPVDRSALDEHRYAASLSLTAHGGAHRRDVVTAFGAAAREGLDERTLDAFVQDWVPRDDGTPVGVGVAEGLHRRRDVLPGNHLLRALGPRPATHREHQLWLGAAHAIDRYRARWDVRDAKALGTDDGAALAALPTRRLADHLRTTRLVETVCAQLGRRPPHSIDLGLTR